MYCGPAADFDGASVDAADISDLDRIADYTLNKNHAYHTPRMSSDQLDQATAVQALMDLNASFGNQYSEAGKYTTSSFAPETLYKYDKKTCNCTKSHCLKLYCECFARGDSCDGCNCSNCMNNFSFEEDRRKAIQQTLERNPLAFCPKIGSSVKKHSKGCNCKRSNCLKNYCECFEAKISCSDLCKCKGCRNFVGSVRSDFIAFITSSHDSQQSKKGFFVCVTPGIIEVVCSCMLSQLFLTERQSMPESDQEAVILAEFSKCLDHILRSFNKLRDDQAILDSSGKFPSSVSSSNVPQFVDAVIPYPCPSNFHEATELPMEQNSFIAFVPDEFGKFEADNINHRMYPDYNYIASSEASEYPLTAHYDSEQSSYWPALSAGGGEFSELPRCTAPNGSLSLVLYDKTEIPSHQASITSPRLLQLPQQDKLSAESAMDQQIFSERIDVNYPLTHSNEADLAAAAISGEINATRSSNLSDVCDFESDLNYFDAHGEATIYPNTLSSPFDFIPSDF